MIRSVAPAPSLGHDCVYGLDIETDTTVDGLDPLVSPIVSVALAGAESTDVFSGPERTILFELNEVLASIKPGVLVTWNGSGFDLPFLAQRAALWNLPIGLRLRPFPSNPSRFRGAWSQQNGLFHRHLDGYLLYRADVGRVVPISCGLKPLARLAGLHPIEVDRTLIHSLSPAELHAYVASDAEIARDLVLRRWDTAIGWFDPH